MSEATILVGDVRQRLSDIVDGSVQCCVTSPPYWGLRDYGNGGQIGLEQTPDGYVAELVAVFREVRRVLRDDGVLWLNLGDSYAGSGKGPAGNLGATHNERHMEHKHSAIVPEGLKPKDLVGIPWRVAFALQSDGWYLRQDIIWAKPNPMPESVKDRCTKSHEYLFLLTKSNRYYFDDLAIAEPATTKPGATWAERKAAGATAGNVIVGHETRNGTQRVVHGKGVTSNLTRQDGLRNKRSVWTINTKPFRGAHFAVMPEALVEPCVLASTRPNDLVLDPFTGSGTVAVVALKHGRNFIGTELNPEYAEIAKNRIESSQPMFNEVNVDFHTPLV
jgi:DNA modification methylase